MKRHILAFTFLLPLFLCFQKDEKEKINLKINSSEWYTNLQTFNNNNFCEVHLKIGGTTNAELISIETYGDGLVGCREIKCNSENYFNEDVTICFFPIRDSTKRKFGTILTAYTSKIKPKISFCEAVGSGDTLRIKLESPFLNCK